MATMITHDIFIVEEDTMRAIIEYYEENKLLHLLPNKDDQVFMSDDILPSNKIPTSTQELRNILGLMKIPERRDIDPISLYMKGIVFKKLDKSSITHDISIVEEDTIREIIEYYEEYKRLHLLPNEDGQLFMSDDILPSDKIPTSTEELINMGLMKMPERGEIDPIILYMKGIFKKQDKSYKLNKAATLTLSIALLEKGLKPVLKILIRYDKIDVNMELGDLIYAHGDPEYAMYCVYAKAQKKEDSKEDHQCSFITWWSRFKFYLVGFFFILNLVTNFIFAMGLFLDGCISLGMLSVFFIMFPIDTTNHLPAFNRGFNDALEDCLAHKRRTRMWVILEWMERMSTSKLHDKLLEHIPHIILQLYVMINKFYFITFSLNKRTLIYEYQATGLEWNFANVNNIFSLGLSIMLLPKAIIDAEDSHRHKTFDRYDFTKFKICNELTFLNRPSLMRYYIYKNLVEYEISLQMFLKYFIYTLMLISRVASVTLVIILFNPNDTPIEDYGLCGLMTLLVLYISRLMFVSEYRIFLASFTITMMHGRFRKAIQLVTFRKLNEFSRIAFCILIKFIIPYENEDYDRDHFVTGLRKVFLPHVYNIIQMTLLGLSMKYYFIRNIIVKEYKGYTCEFIVYIESILFYDVGAYFVAVCLYLLYWVFCRPEQLGAKAEWKKKQKMLRDRLKFDDFAKHGCGTYIDCDYKNLRIKLMDEKEGNDEKIDISHVKSDETKYGSIRIYQSLYFLVIRFMFFVMLLMMIFWYIPSYSSYYSLM